MWECHFNYFFLKLLGANAFYKIICHEIPSLTNINRNENIRGGFHQIIEK